MAELNDEQLENVTGGYWNRSTLSQEERDELNRLIEDFHNGVGNSFNALDAYIQKLNEMYDGHMSINNFI